MSSGRTLITVGKSTKENPCRYCTTEQGRAWDCHGSCDRYTAWNNGHKADREARQEQQREEADFVQLYVPVLNKGDSYRWMPGEVEKMLRRCIYVRYQIGEVRLLGCWFPEDIRRRSE